MQKSAMSRAYDTIEPSVVDEDMLQKAVEEQGPKDEAGRIAKDEGLDFADVKELRLDFRNILKIENLWCFKQLVKLQLDNNIIEKIEGLDTLVTLVWLDLSFNNIEVIEGLDKLTKLEDLTLYNNRIQKLEGMDALTQLHVFSVGNNDIKDLDGSVKYMRKFKHLQTLNFSGNPICELEHYKRYTAACLPQLEYLDYRLIDEATRSDGLAVYESIVSSLQHEEEEIQRRESEMEKKEKEKQYHKEAYVENLNGPELFQNLYADDADGRKLQTLQSIKDMDVDFEKKFTAICQQIFEYGLKKQEERAQEVQIFWECIHDAKDENRKQGVTVISEIQTYRKQLLQDLHNIQDAKIVEEKVSEYQQKITDLWNSLMTYEMQLVDQLEEVIKDFERNINEAMQSFLEVVQGYFTQLRDLENQHHERLTEIAMVTLEKVAKNEAEEMTDDVRDLFADKDTITNVLASSHDAHLLKIDNREDDIVTKIHAWVASLLQKAHEEEEIHRNRARITEINTLCDHLREEIQDFDLLSRD